MADSEDTKNNEKIRTLVWAALLLWLVLVFILGAREAFVREPGAPPLPILAGGLTPILAFLAAFWFSRPFHEFVMSLDLQLASGIQAWRFGGMIFIALYVYGVLPGLFAWPAGLGDMAIGATAPWVMLALRRKTDFAASRLFRVWNLLGILDLVNAVSLGALSSVLSIGISEMITTFPMAQLPLVLIPAFLVPLFVMVHLACLFQAGHLEKYRWVCSRVRSGPTETPA